LVSAKNYSSSHQVWVCLTREQEHFCHFIIEICQGNNARIWYRFYVTEALNCLWWLVCTSGSKVLLIWGERVTNTSRFLSKWCVIKKSVCFCFHPSYKNSFSRLLHDNQVTHIKLVFLSWSHSTKNKKHELKHNRIWTSGA
jgi:hypothetical protein